MQWVLIRGLVSERYHWGRFVSQLEGHFPQHRFHSADILGNRLGREKLTPLQLSKNLAGLRSQVTSPGKKILLGFSLGGMLALEWAYAHPDEVAAVVLINSSLNSSPIAKRLQPQALLTILRSARQKTLTAKEEIILKMTTGLVDEVRIKAIAEDWGRHSLENPIRAANFFLQLGLAAQIKPRPTPPSSPVLILSSGKDRVVHPSCSLELAERLQLQPKVHPEAGHDLTLEDPQWVLEQLEEWVKTWQSVPEYEQSTDLLQDSRPY
jgi:pimeloyl-[acyl-carrier protein] methyl ester esterase